jgi:hypothetical protein
MAYRAVANLVDLDLAAREALAFAEIGKRRQRWKVIDRVIGIGVCVGGLASFGLVGAVGGAVLGSLTAMGLHERRTKAWVVELAVAHKLPYDLLVEYVELVERL